MNDLPQFTGMLRDTVQRLQDKDFIHQNFAKAMKERGLAGKKR